MNVTVVGTGYVGLVTGVCLASVGHTVTCIDLQADRVDTINRGESPIYEPGLGELLLEQLRNGRFRATTSLEAAVVESDATMIAVGTPLRDREIDLSFVIRAAADIGTALRRASRDHVVIVKSTVVPTTTDTVVANALAAAAGKAIGEQIGLAMNPEFLQEGSAVDNFLNPDRIVIGGWDERSSEAAARLYAGFDCPVLRTTLRNAELIKYASNALLGTMISFSNELAALCEKLPGLDIETVMDGLQLDRRLTPLHNGEAVRPGILSYLRAGSGFGGSCLPKDIRALQSFSMLHGAPAPLLSAVMAVNDERPCELVERTQAVIGNVTARKIAVLGLAFKPGTDDMRDSPALKLVDELLRRDASVCVYDPVAVLDDVRVVRADSLNDAVTGASAAIVATAWPEFAAADWTSLLSRMAERVVVDGRNALRHVVWPADVQYVSVGRFSQ